MASTLDARFPWCNSQGELQDKLRNHLDASRFNQICCNWKANSNWKPLIVSQCKVVVFKIPLTSHALKPFESIQDVPFHQFDYSNFRDSDHASAGPLMFANVGRGLRVRLSAPASSSQRAKCGLVGKIQSPEVGISILGASTRAHAN